jgi:hypothetical protein
MNACQNGSRVQLDWWGPIRSEVDASERSLWGPLSVRRVPTPTSPVSKPPTRRQSDPPDAKPTEKAQEADSARC